MKVAEQIKQTSTQQEVRNNLDKRRKLFMKKLMNFYEKHVYDYGYSYVLINVDKNYGWDCANNDILHDEKYWTCPGKDYKNIVYNWLLEEGFIVEFTTINNSSDEQIQYIKVSLWDK